mmetsp:Transcript_98132/g.192685  ORF Transcript_98132/g.192685 Transcript_98132/m.192685 type:complete len:99 (+) Transcript_98132:76-372(+)
MHTAHFRCTYGEPDSLEQSSSQYLNLQSTFLHDSSRTCHVPWYGNCWLRDKFCLLFGCVRRTWLILMLDFILQHGTRNMQVIGFINSSLVHSERNLHY